MITKLCFDSVEDAEELKWAQHGHLYHTIIQELASHCRKIEKYESDKYSEDYLKGVDEVKTKLWEIVGEYNCQDDF